MKRIVAILICKIYEALDVCVFSALAIGLAIIFMPFAAYEWAKRNRERK